MSTALDPNRQASQDGDTIAAHPAHSASSVDGLHDSDLAQWVGSNPKSTLADLQKQGITFSGELMTGPPKFIRWRSPYLQWGGAYNGCTSRTPQGPQHSVKHHVWALITQGLRRP